MDEVWRFTEPKSTMVFTTKRVIYRRFPVLVAIHHEDGRWHFLDSEPVDRQEGALVTLEQMLKMDPDLSVLADLPAGWRASRLAYNQPWQRTEV